MKMFVSTLKSGKCPEHIKLLTTGNAVGRWIFKASSEISDPEMKARQSFRILFESLIIIVCTIIYIVMFYKLMPDKITPLVILPQIP